MFSFANDNDGDLLDELGKKRG